MTTTHRHHPSALHAGPHPGPVARRRASSRPPRHAPVDGVPVVLVHGTRASSAIWAEQVAALRDAGHHPVAVDLPGHGTRVHERFTLRGALDVIGDAVARCATPPVLVGMSLGGYTSLAFAARNHGKVAGVVLSGCSTEIRGKPLQVYRRLSPHLAKALRRAAGWHVVTDMLGAMHGHSSLADLRRLQVPVWLVNGQRDPLRLDERRFVAAHPRARLTVVPRAGHDVNLHAPATFNRVLLAVLTELRTAGSGVQRPALAG